MDYKDYYQIMGLAKTASKKEIKHAYRKLARKYHPDVSDVDNAEEKFKALSEAYKVLIDPEKRAAYDRFGHNQNNGQPYTSPDWDAEFEYNVNDDLDRNSAGCAPVILIGIVIFALLGIFGNDARERDKDRLHKQEQQRKIDVKNLKIRRQNIKYHQRVADLKVFARQNVNNDISTQKIEFMKPDSVTIINISQTNNGALVRGITTHDKYLLKFMRNIDDNGVGSPNLRSIKKTPDGKMFELLIINN